MTDKNWWKPEKLLKNQKKISLTPSAGPPNKKSDFYSYKVMLETNDRIKSNIKLHNEIKPIL